MPRTDHIGVVVKDLDAATDFFLALGFELEGRAEVSGEFVDRVIGLYGVRSEIAMLVPPDGGSKLELSKFLRAGDVEPPQIAPSNRLGLRHFAVEVDDLAASLATVRERGFDLVGEVQDYEDVFRLCYVRGPEGLIVELAERLNRQGDISSSSE